MEEEEQLDYCNIKSVVTKAWKASCSALQELLIFNKANTWCINNFSNSEKAAQAEYSCHSQNPNTSNIFSYCSCNRSSSFPVRDPSSKPQFDMSAPQVPVSMSVPGRNAVIVKSASMPCQRQHDIDSVCLEVNQTDEEIPEEAVCRICLVSLNEGGSWFNLQCCCKGDLSLVHKECAGNWFGTKGNSECDVCRNNVTNLLDTLIWVPSGSQSNIGQPGVVQEVNSEVDTDRNCNELIVLFLMSSICYLFFIMQLLATRMKYNAIMIATPFSMTLGILGSVMSVNSACRGHTWAYSTFQFTSVVAFLHIFLSMLELHVALAMLFASFAGLGLTVGLNYLCVWIIAWRLEGRHYPSRTNVNLA